MIERKDWERPKKTSLKLKSWKRMDKCLSTITLRTSKDKLIFEERTLNKRSTTNRTK